MIGRPHCVLGGPWREPIVRSLITLKMLTYEPTGGTVAAPTTSLPIPSAASAIGITAILLDLRDATLALYALMTAGYRNEARAWREWLLRSVAGHPAELQIMYGIAGERRLTELELDWLSGYAKDFRARSASATPPINSSRSTFSAS